MRARLLAKLGLELHWSAADRDRRVSLSNQALDIARKLGDPPTLAAVLLPRYATIWAPDTVDERLANLDELDEVVGRIRDPVMASHAKSLRFRLMMEMANVRAADRSLDEWAASADELGQPVIRWLLRWPRAARLALAGRLAEPEQAAVDTMDLGFATGQEDAGVICAWGLFPVRLQQGRLAEFEPQYLEVLKQYGISDRHPWIFASLVLPDTELQREDRARPALESMTASGFAGCPVDVSWLVVMAMWAEIAAALGDTQSAVVLRDALNPYRDRLAYMATVIMGTVAFHLGLLATTTGDFDTAASDFADAEAIEERIGAPTWLARTRLEWARMLLRRSGHGDSQRARELLLQALDTARA